MQLTIGLTRAQGPSILLSILAGAFDRSYEPDTEVADSGTRSAGARGAGRARTRGRKQAVRASVAVPFFTHWRFLNSYNV